MRELAQTFDNSPTKEQPAMVAHSSEDMNSFDQKRILNTSANFRSGELSGNHYASGQRQLPTVIQGKTFAGV